MININVETDKNGAEKQWRSFLTEKSWQRNGKEGKGMKFPQAAPAHVESVWVVEPPAVAMVQN